MFLFLDWYELGHIVADLGAELAWSSAKMGRSQRAKPKLQRLLSVGDRIPRLQLSDGNYVEGFSKIYRVLFEGITWSSPSVLTETMAKAHGMGLRVHTLAQGYDLDHLDDVQRFLADDTIRGTHGESVAAIEQWCTRKAACPS